MTYKFIYIEDRQEIRLRVLHEGKKTEFTIVRNKSIDATEFAQIISRGRVKTENSKYQRIINHYSEKLDRLIVEIKMAPNSVKSIKDVRELVDRELFHPYQDDDNSKEPSNSFISYYRECAEKKGNKSYRTSCLSTLDKIQKFDSNSSALTFDDINIRWLNAFDEWMVDCELAQNSRNIHFKNIRSVMNRAMDEELTQNYPFRRFKIKPEATRKRALTLEQLRTLFDYDVQPYQEFYRDMFKLIFMLRGINTVDLHRLTSKSISAQGYIEYRRAKTKRLYSVKIEPEMAEIINRYKGVSGLTTASDRWLDHMDFCKNLNIALKKIGKCEIVGRGGKKQVTSLFPELSSYWARHTWATIASSLDIPKDTIAHALGHGNDTVTDIYIDFDQSKVDKANRQVLDWVLYGKR